MANNFRIDEGQKNCKLCKKETIDNYVSVKTKNNRKNSYWIVIEKKKGAMQIKYTA